MLCARINASIQVAFITSGHRIPQSKEKRSTLCSITGVHKKITQLKSVFNTWNSFTILGFSFLWRLIRVQLLLLPYSFLHNFSLILFAFNSSHRTLFPTDCLSTLFHNSKHKTGGQQEEKNVTPTTATYLLGQEQSTGTQWMLQAVYIKQKMMVK